MAPEDRSLHVVSIRLTILVLCVYSLTPKMCFVGPVGHQNLLAHYLIAQRNIECWGEWNNERGLYQGTLVTPIL